MKLLFPNKTSDLSNSTEVLCLLGAVQLPAWGCSAVFTNIEIALDEVSIKWGMCLWQISTLDNMGCFFLPSGFAHLFFSVFFFPPVAMLFLPVKHCVWGVSSVCACLCFFLKKACFYSGRCLCLSLYYLYKSRVVSWNVKSHMSKEHNKICGFHFLCTGSWLCSTHLSCLFT